MTTTYYMKMVDHYMEHDQALASSIEDVAEDPTVQRFLDTEMAHLLKSPVLRELSEKMALKFGIDPKLARNSILKALKLRTAKVK